MENVVTISKPAVEIKGWGAELVIINGDDYCAKILRFDPGSKGSLHFHALKHETWYILQGSLDLTTVDRLTGKTETRSFSQGDVIDIPRLCPHQVYTSSGVEIMEASTKHFDTDTYRIAPGDSQRVSGWKS